MKKGITKKDIAFASAYLALGLGCIVIATEIDMPYVWHDAILIIGGILIGIFCSMVVLIDIASKKFREDNKNEGGK